MSIIYKATNLINGKIYVGQTISSLKKRKKEHFYDSKKLNFKFYRAIRKYGEDNFKFEIIETVPKDKLNEREIYWISKLNTYKNGYNCTLGGEGASGAKMPEKRRLEQLKAVEKWTENGIFIKIFKSINSASKETEVSGSCISNACRGIQKTSGGFQWKYVNDDNKTIKPIKSIRKIEQIEQYDFNANYIKTFKSAREAEKYSGISFTQILRCCKKEFKYAGNFQWKFKNDNSIIKKFIKPKYNKPIVCYNQNLIIVQKYKSLREAEKKTGINRKSIKLVCEKKYNQAGNFIWRYENDDPPKEKIKLSKIIHIDKNILNKYKSLREAERKTGIDRKKIKQFCNDKNNFMWYLKDL